MKVIIEETHHFYAINGAQMQLVISNTLNRICFAHLLFQTVFWGGCVMKPIITLGLCVRNGEKLLRNALDSILNQDFPHEQMQVILVDDGSQDSTPEIISEYAQKLGHDTKFFKTSWRGLGHARNLVVEHADGKYVLWVDSDEILTRSYVTKQVSVMEKNPRLGITSGIPKTIPGKLVLNLELIPYIVNQMIFDKPRNFIWKTKKVIGTGGSTFRMDALRQVNCFDERIKGAGEDVDLFMRLRKAGWNVCLNDGEFYELHGGMSTFLDLWKKYVWYGYGCQKIHRRNRGAFSIPRMSPIAGIATGVLYSLLAYKLLHQKTVFLLPIHFGLKMTAWMFGFMKGQLQPISHSL
jgi:glycosyltransferase involved in cell wall biosynthesis